MKGRGSFEFLAKTAEKKPDLQKYVDDLETYTYKEIEELPVKKWIKKAMQIELHRRESLKRIKYNDVEVKEFNVYRYTGVIREYGVISIEPSDNDFIMDLGNDKIKVNRDLITLKPGEYEKLFKEITFHGTMMYNEYSVLVSNYLNNKHNISAENSYDLHSIVSRGVKFN